VYEHRTKPLLPIERFLSRALAHGALALLVMGASLLLGIVGYRVTENMSWLEALLNASMILGGMGPVDTLHNDAGKLFASFYALYSGVVFLVSAGVLMAPWAHRLLHSLHLQDE
jgi:hypothetical protein